MSFFEFPHTRTYESDLGWLIRHLLEMDETLRNFINFNTIKYADPIAWNITAQYEANTVVINPSDGTAYISTRPVPSGVPITNTSYWTPIFNYGESMDHLREQIAAANEESSATATRNYSEGDLLWIEGTLYRTLYAFNAGTAFVENTNVIQTTVEDEIKRLIADIGTINSDISDIANDIDTINNTLITVGNDITNLSGRMQDAEDDIDALEAAVSTIDVFIDPRDFGAVGDGVTDDTAAFLAAIAKVGEIGGGTIIVPKGYTFIVTRIRIDVDNVRMLGLGGILKEKDNTAQDPQTAYYIIDAYNVDNITLENLTIDGNAVNNDDFSVFDAITCAGGKNNVVKGCYIYNAPDSGIMFSNLTDSMCVDNVIEGFRDCGIYCNKGSGNNGAYNIVSRNIIDGGSLNPNGSGIALKRVCWKFIVAENVIHNVANGITLENASANNDYSTDIMIANNWIERFIYTGIGLRASFRCSVSNNYIYGDNANYGILIDGNCCYNTIASNIIQGITNFAGVAYTIRDNHYPKTNVLSANIINVASPYGIQMLDNVTPNAQSTFNIIIGNRVVTSHGSGIGIYVGIYFQKTSITGNIFSAVSKDAVFKAGMLIISGNMYEHASAEYSAANTSSKVGSIGTAQIFAANAATIVGAAVNAKAGDITLNTEPASGEYVGWVYNGSAWLPFGAIV